MMLFGVGRRSLTAGLIVFLAACAGQSITTGAPPALESGTSALRFAPGASPQDLLYISSIENSKPNVLIYTYPNGRFKRRVDKAALILPHGECADKRGDVYVTNGSSDSSSTLIEYGHGGVQPIRTLTVNGSATQCSVDQMTGDLAVISSHLAIFRAARGKPTYYRYPAGFEQAACDYDDKGNLFIDGLTKQSPARAALIELTAGKGAFAKVKMPDIGEARVPGDVRWDGKDLALGDGVNTIFRLAVTGDKAKEVGSVQLYGGADVESIWIADGDIVGANFLNRSVMIWGYPGGGQPLKVLNSVGRGDGVAVSLPPRK
jgi:hypothetical protein